MLSWGWAEKLDADIICKIKRSFELSVCTATAWECSRCWTGPGMWTDYTTPPQTQSPPRVKHLKPLIGKTLKEDEWIRFELLVDGLTRDLQTTLQHRNPTTHWKRREKVRVGAYPGEDQRPRRNSAHRRPGHTLSSRSGTNP